VIDENFSCASELLFRPATVPEDKSGGFFIDRFPWPDSHNRGHVLVATINYTIGADSESPQSIEFGLQRFSA
jgi:hypothetical protein